MLRELVITSDLSSGGMVRQLLNKEGRKKAQLFACFEDFTFGPLLPTSEPEQLLRLRHRYWHKTGIAEIGERPPERRSLRKLIQQSDRVEIMIAGEGREQLFLLGLSTLLRQIYSESCVVQLFQYPSTKRWHSLAMLNLDKLSNRPNPTPVDDKLLTLLKDTWSVIISDTPKKLFEAHRIQSQIEGLPYLTRAFDDLISSYPQAANGLNLAEERLLKALPREWTNSARVVGKAMVGDELDGRSFGDGMLFSLLVKLADQKRDTPAVELRGNRDTMRACEVRITDFGEACLKGEANYVAANGIDMWVGGVHLSSVGNRIWFRNPDGTLATI